MLSNEISNLFLLYFIRTGFQVITAFFPVKRKYKVKVKVMVTLE